MILGLGCDLAGIERLRNAVSRPGVLDKVFTPAEKREAARYREPGSYYAGRWAAKEAAAKALGCGFGSGCSFTDIEVLNDELGAPRLNCKAPAAKAFNDGKLRFLVSISHEKAYAVATVVIETSE